MARRKKQPRKSFELHQEMKALEKDWRNYNGKNEYEDEKQSRRKL